MDDFADLSFEASPDFLLVLDDELCAIEFIFKFSVLFFDFSHDFAFFHFVLC